MNIVNAHEYCSCCKQVFNVNKLDFYSSKELEVYGKFKNLNTVSICSKECYVKFFSSFDSI
jgi:hypothetical protein